MRDLLARLGADQREILHAVGGVIKVDSGGVFLFIDTDNEEAYIETRAAFDVRALRSAEAAAMRLGYEPLDEWECPEVHYPDGVIRFYLAQFYFPEESPDAGQLYYIDSSEEAVEVA